MLESALVIKATFPFKNTGATLSLSGVTKESSRRHQSRAKIISDRWRHVNRHCRGKLPYLHFIVSRCLNFGVQSNMVVRRP